MASAPGAPEKDLARAILIARNCEPEGASNENEVDHKGNQGRDCKVESGSTTARRSQGDKADGTTAQNISSREKTNRTGTTSKVGKDQGRKEIEGVQTASARSLTQEPAGCTQNPGQ